MRSKALLIATLGVALAAAAFSTRASAGDPVAGALIGGGIGAAVGGPPGAAVGAVLGTIIGAESRPYYYRGGYYRDEGYYEPRYREGRYYAPPVYYAAPAYYGPAVVYRSYPSYGYDRRYARVRDGRYYRDDRRWR